MSLCQFPRRRQALVSLPKSPQPPTGFTEDTTMNILVTVLCIVGVTLSLLAVNLLIQCLYGLFVSRKG